METGRKLASSFQNKENVMRPVVKMVLLFILIIIVSALLFVILDDEDTKSSTLDTSIITKIK